MTFVNKRTQFRKPIQNKNHQIISLAAFQAHAGYKGALTAGASGTFSFDVATNWMIYCVVEHVALVLMQYLWRSQRYGNAPIIQLPFNQLNCSR